ncbi:DUF7009 family protein [Salinibacter altiplanensis]|uniref:DUF7009 family protein n=1 Tax=Salinibacter altiplanensis TaxID=1803181 RepID=UPI000C9F95EE|nr:hypothetical protein [Salinibacter altiplanensis]
MKLRLTPDSVRIRVFQDDLDTFRSQGRVTATTHIGPSGSVTYGLKVDPEAEQPRAALDGTTLMIRVPRALGERWVTADQVGFEADQEVGDDRTVHLLVEKDIGCQHKEATSEKAFPHLADRD